ncbi:hypothetical protein LO771_06120 [Streptacidiphilus sp. ASG 303]|uniref:hypothetical protein n=1 Tax=Streptacidiphilus sp. ASG 303 TaxID=2896847 RepID=UPI001E29F242|nr:hypothetical protein [Streptacidiphilus sp. ASG 303]MCD0482003.1 hypothetical protein [Streptacidiphilus sp. ASG 303]
METTPRPDEADDRLPIERAAPERRSGEEAAAEAVPRHPARRPERFTEALDRITAEDGELLRRLAGR